jgi:putative transposase
MTYWQLFYHAVWTTRDRLALIDPAWEKDLYDYIWKRALTLDCIPYAIGGMPDHVHVAISIPPTLSVGSLIVQLKGSSSHHVNESYLDGSFLWQSDYRVSSFSQSSLFRIVNYVQDQKQHHATRTLETILENCPRQG